MTTIKTGTSLLTSAGLLGACAFLVLSDQPAFAEEPAQADRNDFRFGFEYSPEELQSDGDASAMLERLEHQIERRCKGSSRAISLGERRSTQECVDATLEANVGKFGSDAIASSYRNRTDG